MTVTLKDCERTAKRLPLPERSLLIEHLIGSLDDLDEAECERLWVAEAKRRFAEFQAGKVPARPAKEVFREARARLAALR